DFAGWQWQTNQRTVQAELEAALLRITQEPTKCGASGRTDAGVHALGQVVSFQSATRLTGPALCKALNAELPEDMVGFELAEWPPEFHGLGRPARKPYSS